MFSYVDPSIKKLLLEQKKLFRIDASGRRCGEPGAGPPFISMVGPVPLPVRTPRGQARLDWYAWVRKTDLERIEQVVETVRAEGPRELFHLLSDHLSVNSIFLHGDFANAVNPLVRVHSNCLTGDIIGSMRCDCGPQLDAALAAIVAKGAGALIYMSGHEGRGIGLWAKAITYLLQDGGQDTYQANERLGLPTDSRTFSDAGLVLKCMRGDGPIHLLGNNPLKRADLEKAGVTVSEQVTLVVGITEHNERYLRAKSRHGHLIDESEL